MEVREIILLICLGVLVLVNLGLIAVRIIKLRKNNEITLDVDDYLTLILQQLDQVAGDMIEVSSVNKDDFENEDDYCLAILAITKQKVLEDGEEYGLSSNVLKLIDKSKLETYLLDSIKVIVENEDKTAEAEAVISDKHIEDAVSEDVTTYQGDAASDSMEDIGEAIQSVYDDPASDEAKDLLV